jgi:hypothetical protein
MGKLDNIFVERSNRTYLRCEERQENMAHPWGTAVNLTVPARTNEYPSQEAKI